MIYYCKLQIIFRIYLIYQITSRAVAEDYSFYVSSYHILHGNHASCILYMFASPLPPTSFSYCLRVQSVHVSIDLSSTHLYDILRQNTFRVLFYYMSIIPLPWINDEYSSWGLCHELLVCWEVWQIDKLNLFKFSPTIGTFTSTSWLYVLYFFVL